MKGHGFQKWLTLEEWLWTFIMMGTLKIAPHVVVLPTKKSFLLPLHTCNFATVLNHDLNIWYAAPVNGSLNHSLRASLLKDKRLYRSPYLLLLLENLVSKSHLEVEPKLSSYCRFDYRHPIPRAVRSPPNSVIAEHAKKISFAQLMSLKFFLWVELVQSICMIFFQNQKFLDIILYLSRSCFKLKIHQCLWEGSWSTISEIQNCFCNICPINTWHKITEFRRKG